MCVHVFASFLKLTHLYQDNFRIVVFCDIGSVTLPSHIPMSQHPACARPGDRFLREHFRRCLTVNILGGDISEDYDPNDIVPVMEELGMCGGNDDDTPLAAIDDERWDTVLGKELWDKLMRDAFFDWDASSKSSEDDSILC
jgi:hypothetical protein